MQRALCAKAFTGKGDSETTSALLADYNALLDASAARYRALPTWLQRRAPRLTRSYWPLLEALARVRDGLGTWNVLHRVAVAVDRIAAPLLPRTARSTPRVSPATTPGRSVHSDSHSALTTCMAE